VAFGEEHRSSCFAEAARVVLAALEQAEQAANRESEWARGVLMPTKPEAV
jgi:hypothetical protein